MARIKYDRILTVDTESNPDGSLYIISLYNGETNESKLFYTLKDYYDYIYKDGLHTLIYVHNFGKWDSYFLLTEELQQWETDVIAKDKQIFKYFVKREYTYKYTSRQNKTISKKKHQYITYEDTLPKTMISLEKFADTIGEPYTNIPDYDIYREPGKPETWEDRELLEAYAVKDVVILYKLLDAYRKVYGENFDKAVTAGSLVWRETVYEGVPEDKTKWAHREFRKIITELTPEEDADIRKGYMGGITTPFFSAGVVLDDDKLRELYPWFENPVIRADDISSAYAWAQVRDLPLGRVFVSKDKDHVERLIMNESFTSIFRIKFSYDSCDFPVIPKMNMIPQVQLVAGVVVENQKADYVNTMLNGNNGYAVISSIDLRYALKNEVYHNLKYEIIPFDNGTYGYSFKLGKYKNIVDITNKYYDLKNNATDGASRQAFKSPLVNLYGKTGERVHTHENTLNVLTREITSEEMEEAKIGRYSNVAVASTITSYVHHKLYERGKEVGFINMLYTDTDSMFYVSENDPVVVVDEVLGAWNNEIDGTDRALFICPKKYILEKDNKIQKVAKAGIDRNDNTFTIDNWKGGLRTYYKRDREIVPGGVKLVNKVVDATASRFDFYDPREVLLW